MTDIETLRYESTFPVANHIRAAKSAQERALILMRLSDAALLSGHVDIELACIQAGFAAGQTFLVWRVAALCRQRDAHGMLPETLAGELEAWRLVMSRVAAGVAGLAITPAVQEAADGN